jgi:hypothetical protein
LANRLVQIEEIDDWVSARLGIRFVIRAGAELIIYRPDGEKFIGFGELDELRQIQQQRADSAELRAAVSIVGDGERSKIIFCISIGF